MDCKPPGSSVHGILQAKILEWVAISFSRGSSQLRDLSPASPALAAGFFTTSTTWEAHLYIYIHMYGERVNRYGQALSHLAK